MKFDGDFGDHHNIVSFDIETTHYDPTKGETVAIGVGQHEIGSSASEAQYRIFARENPATADERDLVERAVEYINRLNGDTLVSYNGIEFDMDFLSERCAQFDPAPGPPRLHETGRHIDLFAGRKEACGPNDKWPSLEECLDSYDLPVPRTVWNGSPLDNTRFGTEFAPAFLDALADGDEQEISRFRGVLDHYLTTDLEANIALYCADQGLPFDPVHLRLHGEFQT
ncbi:ribonuclease H-like domain-containing protein [Halorubrum sp. HHNYT27]|uniref:ribonuclease H-like domain-containing protein n=1 Tax=Halorubrum sp. HHNYT27 TaxID=3402275 RepID=UPI003EBAADCA